MTQSRVSLPMHNLREVQAENDASGPIDHQVDLDQRIAGEAGDADAAARRQPPLRPVADIGRIHRRIVALELGEKHPAMATCGRSQPMPASTRFDFSITARVCAATPCGSGW
ncbi:MAG: hypothetical protein JWP04_152 [Belnapia sp.]|nr:hypothetical protein [Belnapia sp.]